MKKVFLLSGVLLTLFMSACYQVPWRMYQQQPPANLNNGSVQNPSNNNGNTNIIKGEYEQLRIDADGSVYSESECCEKLLSPSIWQVPKGMNYGWTIYPQENSVIVDMGACCGRACVYIRHDAITT